ncbi:MAG: hypothetical protein M3Y49_03715 [Actinomycetota bacterium]|nr:hypothetical protein [Actinomycetota bacterium]
MANDNSGSHSIDPNSTNGGRRQPTGESQPGRWEHDQENDSRHVQPVVRRNDHDDRGDRRREEPAMVDPQVVTTAQEEEHGGIKIGSAFFGWLTATGMAVLLTALAAAIGAGVGVVNNTDITKATTTASSNSKTVGIIGAIVLLLIVLVSYYCGGYVAGRMARFNGLRQGIVVWVWALVIVIVLAVLAVIGGQKYNILATLNVFPRIPVKEGTLTTTGIIALIIVAVAALIGALLGGLAGMHYHRTVDRTGAAVITDRLRRR